MIKIIKAMISEAKKQHGKEAIVETNNITSVRVGRNSLCPICKNNGKIIKFKKCKKHNNY